MIALESFVPSKVSGLRPRPKLGGGTDLHVAQPVFTFVLDCIFCLRATVLMAIVGGDWSFAHVAC